MHITISDTEIPFNKNFIGKNLGKKAAGKDWQKTFSEC